jgi:hypothetical protein
MKKCEAPTPMPALQRSGSDVIPDHAFFDDMNPLKDVENVGWVVQWFELSFDNRKHVVCRIILMIISLIARSHFW